MANDFFKRFVRSLSGDPSMEVEIENLVLDKNVLDKGASGKDASGKDADKQSLQT